MEPGFLPLLGASNHGVRCLHCSKCSLPNKTQSDTLNYPRHPHPTLPLAPWEGCGWRDVGGGGDGGRLDGVQAAGGGLGRRGTDGSLGSGGANLTAGGGQQGQRRGLRVLQEIKRREVRR